MSQYFPYSGFKWLNQKEIGKICLNLIGENSPTGDILEVDLNILMNYMNCLMIIH